jgi:hypothetical protein
MNSGGRPVMELKELANRTHEIQWYGLNEWIEYCFPSTIRGFFPSIISDFYAGKGEIGIKRRIVVAYRRDFRMDRYSVLE